MPWFNVDDNFAFHPKAIQAGNAALGLWVRAGAWCRQTLSEGEVPTQIARKLGRKNDAARLVECGLWVETSDGYRFHEWEQRQRSKADVEADRESNRRRQEAFRERKRAEKDKARNADSNAVTETVTAEERNGVSNGAQAKPSQAKRTTYVGSAADGNVPSARSGSADTFSDGTPIPADPGPEPATHGANALAPVVALHPPATLETGTRPKPPEPTQAARAVVRQVIPGLTRQVIDQLAVHLTKAARDDVPDAAIRAGLERWRDDPGKPNPGALPYRIGDAARELAAQTPSPDQRPARPSKLRLMAELAAAERARETNHHQGELT